MTQTTKFIYKLGIPNFMKQISREDYLRAIYVIYEAQKDKKEGIKSVDIAKHLNVSKASVSEMVRKLAKEGYIAVRPYSAIQFTKKGLSEARRIMHNHRVIEVFLKKILNYNINKVHEEAHRLEHAFSEGSINRLDKFLKNPKISPHGYPIPRYKRRS